MAATKSAGRVSIRVLPDSTGFRRDLKKALDRIENSMSVKIKVNLIVDNSQLAEMKRQIEALAITIKPNIDMDLTVPQADIERIKQQIEAMNPEVQVDMNLNTAAASARIATLTRDRIMRIWPTVMGNGLKNVGKHLAAIAGMSWIVGEIDRGLKFLRSIDTHAINLAKSALMFGSVISIAAGAAQALFAVGDAMIKLTGLLLVAPALVSSFGIGLYALILPLKNIKEELSSLAPAFNEMHAAMNRSFWDEAKEPIETMANHLLPTLSEKMIAASKSMGMLTGEFARSYGEHVTIERFALMFDRVLESMDTVRGAVDPLIQAFTTLGLHGTKYLNRLSKAIVNVSEDFNNWIQLNDQNGNLEKWTEDAISSFKEFGGVIKGVWNVFGALNTAIKTAGGPTLKDLHTGLDNLAATMDSPAFQEAMVHVFRGMNTAIKEIGKGIASLGPGLASIAPEIEAAFTLVGATMKTLLGYFGQIMEHPAVQKGLVDMFSGLLKGVRALEPAIPVLSEMLGSLLTLLGTVLENVGKLVSTILVEWGPSLLKLSETFDSLAEPLRVMAEDVVRALTPAIKTLVDDAIVPLLVWVRDHLIPAVSDFAEDVGPGLKVAMETLGDAIEAALPVLTKLTDFFTKTEGEASDFKKTLDNIILLINDPEAFVNKAFEGEISFDPDDLFPTLSEDMARRRDEEIDQAADEGRGPGSVGKMNKWIYDFFVTIGENIAEEWNKIDWVGSYEKADRQFLELGDKLQAWASDTWNDIDWSDAGNAIGDWFKGQEEEFTKGQAEMDTVFTRFGEDLGNWLGEIGTGIANGFKMLGEGFLFLIGWDQFVADLEMGLKNLKGIWDESWAVIEEDWNAFTNGEITWGDLFTNLMEWLGIDMETLKVQWDEGWNSMMASGEEILGGFTTWFSENWTRAVEEDKARWEEWDLWLNEKWNATAEWARTFWTDFSTFISTKWQEIKDNIKTKLDETGVDQTNAWTIMLGLAQNGWTNMKSMIGQQLQEIKDNIKNKLNEMGIDTTNGWTVLKSATNVSWQAMKDYVRQTLIDMLNSVGLNGEQIVQNMSNAWNRAKETVKNIIAELRREAEDRYNEMVADIRALPGRLADALTGQSLNSSGQSLINSFAQGISDATEGAVATARGALQRIRNLFPNSPAKEGPFSGRGWTPYSGAATIDGFSEGMASRMNNAYGVARKMQKGVAKELAAVNAPTPDGAGVETHRSGNVTLKVYNPVAEPTSRTIARASSLIKLGAR